MKSFTASLPSKTLLSDQFWPHFLNIINEGHPALVSKLSTKLTNFFETLDYGRQEGNTGKTARCLTG